MTSPAITRWRRRLLSWQRFHTAASLARRHSLSSNEHEEVRRAATVVFRSILARRQARVLFFCIWLVPILFTSSLSFVVAEDASACVNKLVWNHWKWLSACRRRLCSYHGAFVSLLTPSVQKCVSAAFCTYTVKKAFSAFGAYLVPKQ